MNQIDFLNVLGSFCKTFEKTTTQEILIRTFNERDSQISWHLFIYLFIHAFIKCVNHFLLKKIEEWLNDFTNKIKYRIKKFEH